MEMIEKLRGREEYDLAASILLKDGLLNRKRVFDNAGVTDHFAIMPTGLPTKKVRQEDLRIYDLVVQAFSGGVLPGSTLGEPRTDDRGAGREVPDPKAQPERAGMAAGPTSRRQRATSFSPFSRPRAHPVEVRDIEIVQEEAKPKSRITEAGLLRLMRERRKTDRGRRTVGPSA